MVLVADWAFVHISSACAKNFAAQRYFAKHESSEQKLVQKNFELLSEKIIIRMDFVQLFYSWYYFTLENGICIFEIFEFF